jgi:peptidoglycan/LPS O-acetylase OafA/YrhL
MSLLKYRSDIDGLRAVAVLGVVIYHAFPQALTGGFSGVDIFFVISGYLISGILYKGHREGGFSFGEFYGRRVRRLFPALITMLALVMGYGWVVLLPDEFLQLGKHVAAGGVFIQNVVYWKESGYFDVAANLKPLLHMWSLAVEEQFYIFFPPLLMVLWKKPRMLVPVMVLLLVVSFVVNVVMSVQDGARDFFLTPYRAWEFLGGSLLAWWHYERGHEEEVPAYREAMSWAGMGLLVGGMALLGKDQAYPGWRALMPVAGTLLVMEAGRGAWVNRRVLSHPAVVWVGLISYPLYLFHWPALSFVHIVKGEIPKPGYVFAALAAAMLLTLITYYLVERPLRHNRSRWVVPSLVTAFLALGISGVLSWSDLLKAHGSDPQLREISLASVDREVSLDLKLMPTAPYCSLTETPTGVKRTLFIGDSNMEQYQPRICSLVSSHRRDTRGVIFFTALGIAPIPGIEDRSHPASKVFFPELNRILAAHHEIDRVVIAANWVWYCSSPVYPYSINGISFPEPRAQKMALAALSSLIDRISASGRTVYFVLNIPVDKSLDPKDGILRGWCGPTVKNSSTLESREFFRIHGDFLKDLKATAVNHGATVIDPMDLFLKDGRFLRADVENRPFYRDSCHLRSSYVRDHISYLDQTVAE